MRSILCIHHTNATDTVFPERRPRLRSLATQKDKRQWDHCYSLRTVEVLLAGHEPHPQVTTRHYKALLPPDHMKTERSDDIEGMQPVHMGLGGDSQWGNRDTSRYSRRG